MWLLFDLGSRAADCHQPRSRLLQAVLGCLCWPCDSWAGRLHFDARDNSRAEESPDGKASEASFQAQAACGARGTRRGPRPSPWENREEERQEVRSELARRRAAEAPWTFQGHSEKGKEQLRMELRRNEGQIRSAKQIRQLPGHLIQCLPTDHRVGFEGPSIPKRHWSSFTKGRGLYFSPLLISSPSTTLRPTPPLPTPPRSPLHPNPVHSFHH